MGRVGGFLRGRWVKPSRKQERPGPKARRQGLTVTEGGRHTQNVHSESWGLEYSRERNRSLSLPQWLEVAMEGQTRTRC